MYVTNESLKLIEWVTGKTFFVITEYIETNNVFIMAHSMTSFQISTSNIRWKFNIISINFFLALPILQ